MQMPTLIHYYRALCIGLSSSLRLSYSLSVNTVYPVTLRTVQILGRKLIPMML